MRDGLEVCAAITLLDEETLIVLKPVGRTRDSVVQAISVIILSHLAHALLVVRRGDDLQVGAKRETHRRHYALRTLHRQARDVHAFTFKYRRQHQLAFPAVTVFGNNRADCILLPPVTTEPLKRGGNIFHHGVDAEMLGEHLAEHECIVRRMMLGHEQTMHLLLAKRSHAQRGDDRTVDTAGDADNGPAAMELTEHLLTQRCGDISHFGSSIQLEYLFVEHDSPFPG